MYCLVLKQLSPIEKGLHASQAIFEYERFFYKNSDYIQWENSIKDIVVLNVDSYQEMKNSIKFLNKKVKYAVYCDVKLNNIITSVAFLLDEQVWNDTDYPYNIDDNIEIETEIVDSDSDWMKISGGRDNIALRKFIFSKKVEN